MSVQQQQIIQLRYKLQKQQQQFQSYKKQCEILQKYLQEQAAKKQAQIRVLKQESIKKQKQTALIKTELNALQGQNRTLKNIIKQFEEKEKELEGKCLRLEAEVKGLGGKVVDVKQQADKGKQKSSSKESQRQMELYKEIEKYQLKITQLTVATGQMTRKIAAAQQEIQKNKQQKEQTEARNKDNINRCLQQINKYKQIVKQKDKTIQQLQQQISHQQQQLAHQSPPSPPSQPVYQAQNPINTSITINSLLPNSSHPPTDLSRSKSKNKTYKTLQITIEKTSTKPVVKEEKYLELKELYKIKENEVTVMQDKISGYIDTIRSMDSQIHELTTQLQQAQSYIQQHNYEPLNEKVSRSSKSIEAKNSLEKQRNTDRSNRGKQMVGGVNANSRFSRNQENNSYLSKSCQSEEDYVEEGGSDGLFSPAHHKSTNIKSNLSPASNIHKFNSPAVLKQSKTNTKTLQTYCYSLYMTTKNYYKIPFLQFTQKSMLRLYKLDKNGKVDKTLGCLKYKFHTLTFNMEQLVNKTAYNAYSVYNQQGSGESLTGFNGNRIIIYGPTKTGKRAIMSGIIGKMKNYIFGKMIQQTINQTNNSMIHNSSFSNRRSQSMPQQHQNYQQHILPNNTNITSSNINLNNRKMHIKYLEVYDNQLINMHLQSTNKSQIIKIIQNIQKQGASNNNGNGYKERTPKSRKVGAYKFRDGEAGDVENEGIVRYLLLQIDDYTLEIVTSSFLIQQLKQPQPLPSALHKLIYSKIPPQDNPHNHQYQDYNQQQQQQQNDTSARTHTQIILTINPIVGLYSQCRDTLRLMDCVGSAGRRAGVNVFEWRDSPAGRDGDGNRHIHIQSVREEKEPQLNPHRHTQQLTFYKTKLKQLLVDIKIMLNSSSQVPYLKKPASVLNLQKIVRTVQMLINHSHSQLVYPQEQQQQQGRKPGHVTFGNQTMRGFGGD